MNIFFLDYDPREAAKAHGDKHVVKMILETAQILSTVRHLQGDAPPEAYRATHENHPCVRWAQSPANYDWLWRLGLALCLERHHRWPDRPPHKSHAVIVALTQDPPTDGDISSPALAMPDCYRGVDPVASYRAYYANEKSHLHRWTNRTPPNWIREYTHG